jgi:hypothetical protein
LSGWPTESANYWLALPGFLDLQFDAPEPTDEDTEALGVFANQRMRYHIFQRTYEDALLAAI